MLSLFRRRKSHSLLGPSLRQQFPDARSEDLETIEAVRTFTMTSAERILALCQAVRYLIQNQISGDIVECGVWRGGSIMAILRTLKQLNACDRRVWLFDTFCGMPAPTARDVDYVGKTAGELLRADRIEDPQSIWCCSSLSEVRANVARCGYPDELVRFVVGPVESTLQVQLPDRIALLRLDTDWYESTRVELDRLFPRLVPGGVLLVDDYGHWQGCRRAVDEYFKKNSICMMLHRIDYTGRIGIRHQAA
jgi:O-methyltransferase